ncbi:MAG: Flp family type IVb pilin [Rhodospirillales bacterium]
MPALLMALLKDDRGATAIEYGLIASLVSAAAVAAFLQLGLSLAGMFGAVNGLLESVIAILGH